MCIQSRKPEINQVLHCKEDKRAEAKEYDTQSACTSHKRPDAENTLAGRVPIELPRLSTFFLQANADNLLTAKVTGKRHTDDGLVVPAKFIAFAQELKIEKILKRELNETESVEIYSLSTKKSHH